MVRRSAFRPAYYTDDKSNLIWNTISDIPTFEEYRKLPAAQKEKFVFLVNGFLHFDKGAIETVKTTLALYPDIPIVGFGEIFGEHDIMTDQMNPPSYIDTKALDPIYELAGENNWFVMIHNNLSHRSFKGPTDTMYRSDIDNVLQRHRNTLFILPHAGISRNIVISNLTEVIDDLLQKNDNLYVDISFVVYENYIIPEGEIDAKWVQLIEKYPDRFLYGSDNLHGYGEFYNVKKYVPLLDALKPETAQKVAQGNFDYLVNRALSKK